MKPWEAKTLSGTVILAVNLFFGLLPVYILAVLKKRERRCDEERFTFSNSRTQWALSLLNCFAGGVFLATTFLHLLPEVREGILDAIKTVYHVDTEIAIPEMIVFCGFFFIMFVEHVAMIALHTPTLPSADITVNMSSNVRTYVHTVDKSGASSESQPLIKNGSGYENLEKSTHSNLDPYGSTETKYGALTQGPDISYHPHNDNPGLFSEPSTNAVIPSHGNHRLSADEHENVCVHIHPSSDPEATNQPLDTDSTRRLQTLRSFILLLALSLHTLFEGLALGLEGTTAAVFSLLLSITLHKGVIAFGLGIKMIEDSEEEATSSKRGILMMVFFSCMCPLGVLIGGLVTNTGSGSANLWASPVLQALATGTFIYVTFLEVLQKELSHGHSISKVFSVLSGFVLFALLSSFIRE